MTAKIKRPAPFIAGIVSLVLWLVLFILLGTKMQEGVSPLLLFLVPALLVMGLFLLHRGIK